MTANGNIGHPSKGDYGSDVFTADLSKAAIYCTGTVTSGTATNHSFTVIIFDPTLAAGSYACTFWLFQNDLPVNAALTVSQAGTGTVSVKRIICYGNYDSASVAGHVKVADGKTYDTETKLIRKDTVRQALYSASGYVCTFSGTVLDGAIASGQAGTVSVEGVTLASSSVTVSNGRAAVTGTFNLEEGAAFSGVTVTDEGSFTTPVTVTVGGKTFTADVTFRRTDTRRKAGSFSVYPTGAAGYVDETGEARTQETWTRLDGSVTELADGGWYYVLPNDTVSCNSRIWVNGSASLILGDGATLSADAGIGVNAGSSLTVYGQSDGTGTLNAATYDGNAAIGGTYPNDGGAVTIRGGVVNAIANANSSGNSGAGIGGSFSKGGGTTTITGGKVTAASAQGESIGSHGYNGSASIVLDWNSRSAPGMEVYTQTLKTGAGGHLDYHTAVTFTKPFVLKGTNTLATRENLAGNTLVPATRITFDANGGTGGMADAGCAAGGSYTLPGCGFTAPEHRHFKGWQVGDDTTTRQPGEALTDVALSAEPLTVKAVWYTEAHVVFGNGGGSGDMADLYTNESSYTLPDCGFTAPEGKVFRGWKINEETTPRQPGFTLMVQPDQTCTVTAVWEQTYTVTVDDAVSGYVTAYPTPTVAGSTVTLALSLPAYLSLTEGSLKATYGGGELSPARVNDTTYIFTMPAADVSVTGAFQLNTADMPYVDARGAAKTPVQEYTAVAASDTSWGSAGATSWYVVTANTTLSSRVAVNGDVNLILCDGTTLTAEKGINVAGTNSLTVWAQSLGGAKGRLVATGEIKNAGIGGRRYYVSSKYNCEVAGTIVINGGDVTATGGGYAAGVGSAGAESSSDISPAQIVRPQKCVYHVKRLLPRTLSPRCTPCTPLEGKAYNRSKTKRAARREENA